MLRLLFLSISIIFVFDSARAFGSCSNVRLDQLGGPLADVPIYNQKKFSKDDINLCWAIAAAQLIDANRAKVKSPLTNLTSPLSVAFERFGNKQKEMLVSMGEASYRAQYQADLSSDKRIRDSAVHKVSDGGDDIEQALKGLRGKEVCDQNFIDQLIDLEGSETSQDRAAYKQGRILSVNDYFYSVLKGIDLRLKGVTITNEVKAKISDRLDGRKGCASKLFDNLSDLNGALQTAAQVDPNVKFSSVNIGAFTSQLCSKNKFVLNYPAPKRLAHQNDAAWKTESINQIDQLLDRGTPIGLSIKSCLTRGPGKCSSDAISYHALVIAGRKKIGNKCQYFLRNSYGEDCKKTSWKCERGGVWVDSDELTTFSSDIYWID